jgi:outer membrane protein OmpA-like peptidoglycan-associated protein
MNRRTTAPSPSSTARFGRVSRTAVASLGCAAVLAAGCSSMGEREQGTAKGAGAGAVAGAVIGSFGGNAGKGAVVGGALGAVAGNLWSKRMEDKRAALAKASQGTGVEVTRTEDNRLKMNIPSDVSFDVGSAAIKPEMRPVLDEISRNIDTKTQVTIVGHTDSTGSDSVNGPLSLERAQAVRDYLQVRGVPTQAMGVQGHGSREPVANNNTDAGRAMNRRVEIFIAERAA